MCVGRVYSGPFSLLAPLQSVQQNGSIYIHVYFTKSGFHPDPRQKALYRRLATVHMSRSKSVPTAQTPHLGIGSLDTAGGAGPLIPGPQGQSGTLSPGRPGLTGHTSGLCGHLSCIWEVSGLRKSSWTEGC